MRSPSTPLKWPTSTSPASIMSQPMLRAIKTRLFGGHRRRARPLTLLFGGATCLLGWLLGSSSGLLASGLAASTPAAPSGRPSPIWPYPDSLDALVAAPKFHRVLFENERVRVLEVTVPPHTREPLHTHRWPSVMYRERYGSGRYYDATGKMVHEFTQASPPGATNPRARWQEPEGPHSVENTGAAADRFVRVELKQ